MHKGRCNNQCASDDEMGSTDFMVGLSNRCHHVDYDSHGWWSHRDHTLRHIARSDSNV